MLHPCALISSSKFFYHVLGPWCHIMWHVMWLQCHMPFHHPKENQKRKQNKIVIKSEKLNKRKRKLSVSKTFHNSMILKNLRIFSQNVWKNKSFTNTLLNINKNFDIIFIQEPLWSTIHFISSLLSVRGKIIVEAPNHLNQVTFSRNSSNNNNYPHVILFINICLTSLQFSLWKDIFNYRDICCCFFFNNGKIFFLLNIYSDLN